MHICYLSPGSSPLPPAPCTSVEIYSKHLATHLSKHHTVTLYAKGRRKYAKSRDRLTTRTFLTPGGPSYLRTVLRDMKLQQRRAPHLLHIENRIPFVHDLKTAYPRLPVLLHLHSNVLARQLPASTVATAFREIDALVVNSRFLKKDLLATYPALLPEKVHVIYPGIDLHAFPSRFSTAGKNIRQKMRRRHAIGDNKQILLFVGRFIPRKGLQELLDAFALVHEKHPNTELWIIGGRPTRDTEFHRQIKHSAARLPVRFFGYLKPSRLPSYYLAADLFICPSQQPEAFGLVNLEAAATGLPVIASAAWGIQESVKHGTSGLLVEDYTSPAAFAAAINSLLDDPRRLAKLNRTAREWVEGEFSWSKTAQRFRRLYRKLTSPS